MAVPYIEVVAFGKRLTPEQKRRLFEEIARVSTRCLDVSLEQVRIAVQEWPQDNCFDGSREVADRRGHGEHPGSL